MGVLTDDMKRIVTERHLGFYATVCPDGTPNLSPKGTTRVWDDDHIVFADIRSPTTIRNLKANPAIEINVVDVFSRKGYRFKGTAQVLSDGPLHDDIAALITSSHGVERERMRAVVLVQVTRALPVTSPAYDQGFSEEQLTEEWKTRFAELHGP